MIASRHSGELSKLCALFCSFSLFLLAYFPSSVPVDNGMEDTSPPPTWKRHVGQLVIVLIDALRADFVLDLHHQHRQTPLPKIRYLEEKLKEKGSFSCTLRCSPPTVTLPRIKAMLTGRKPTYLDVVNNINSEKLTEDSLLSQFNQSGLKIVMFGDETWERISPVQFVRSDPTTSFFVSDYTEVDDNVTRHLEDELERDDWDIMILHYLGLDHIGHLEGPDSKLIAPKLDEMGQIIKKIYTTLTSKIQKEGLPPMVVVLGDHGMADGGGHGGASLQEVLVPLVLLSPLIHSTDEIKNTVVTEHLQMDLAPTFSLLMGTKIPRSSNGRIIPDLVNLLPTEGSHQSRLYNCLQLNSLLSEDSRSKDLLMEAQKQVGMTASSQEEVDLMLEEALNSAQNEILNTGAQYDFYLLVVSILMILMSAGFCFPCERNLASLFLGFVFIQSVHYLTCSVTDSVLCSKHYIFPAINVYFLLSVMSTMKIVCKFVYENRIDFRIILLTLHTVSLLSSSFVEEEHQTYYFLFTTYMFLRAIKSARSGNIEQVVSCVICAGIHRFLRGINQTGDKWKHLSDTSDLINANEQLRVFLLVSSLCLFVVMSHRSRSSTLFNFLLCALIVVQKLYTPVIIVRLVYLLIFLRFMKRGSAILFHTFVFLSFILHSETNILCIVLFVAMLKLVKTSDVVLLYLMSKCLHFYLGNSNSLATIQVGAGYTGLTEYSAVPVVLLLAVHTYSGLLVTYSYAAEQKLRPVTSVHLAVTRLDILVFSVLSFLLRYHIFVWSVFSPKLLYFGMELVVFSAFYLLCMLLQKI